MDVRCCLVALKMGVVPLGNHLETQAIHVILFAPF